MLSRIDQLISQNEKSLQQNNCQKKFPINRNKIKIDQNDTKEKIGHKKEGIFKWPIQ